MNNDENMFVRYSERAIALERAMLAERTAYRVVEVVSAFAAGTAIALAWDALDAKLLVGCFLGWFAARYLLRLLVYVIVLKPLLDKINREHPR